MEFLDHDIASITAFLSSERLATFQSITGTTHDAIMLHQQMLQFGTTLMTVTAIIEIAVRNAVCEKISTLLGGGGWLRTPPAPFCWEKSEREKIIQAEQSARKAAYAKLSYAAKNSLDAVAFPGGVPAGVSSEKISKARQKTIKISEGQLVAQLTMAFWKTMFSKEYELTLWNRTLKRIFPDKKLRRTDLSVQFEEIYQARNRIAHHEPIYDKRLDRVIGAIEFVVANFGKPDATGKTPIAKLLDADLALLMKEADALRAEIESFRRSPNGNGQCVTF